MTTKEKQAKVRNLAAQTIRELIEFCINEQICNPKITMDAKSTDGERYRLIFERLDLDEIPIDQLP